MRASSGQLPGPFPGPGVCDSFQLQAYLAHFLPWTVIHSFSEENWFPLEGMVFRAHSLGAGDEALISVWVKLGWAGLHRPWASEQTWFLLWSLVRRQLAAGDVYFVAEWLKRSGENSLNFIWELWSCLHCWLLVKSMVVIYLCKWHDSPTLPEEFFILSSGQGKHWCNPQIWGQQTRLGSPASSGQTRLADLHDCKAPVLWHKYSPGSHEYQI